ncbi:hypothetical protein AMK68_00450 [candidate division KD3-62 bacterium DG_56]|uniref:PKD domain-containing protein n=1 Tax=candidate division KD3-62 bacterium DG_56 TaxID=1704032 RepID=A0A0S7XRL3_9BACT|nr:MAG: hypothetical protein AMK68_00450 [candidate division KD3-62 bacterium DG_56]
MALFDPTAAGRQAPHTSTQRKPGGAHRSSPTVASLLACAVALSLAVIAPVQAAQTAIPAAPASGQPECDITYSPDNPTTEDVIIFDANASDPDGTIEDCYWNFGDGSPTVAGHLASHHYDDAGPYDVTVEVTDDDGNTVVCFEVVMVTEPICSVEGPDELALGEEACFSCSVDPGVNIVSWEWDFGDFSTASGSDVCHTYETHGSYLVTLVVTDDTGVSSPCSHHVIEIKPPVIEISTELSRGWHMISLPLEPVDPDPEVVFAGLPISGNLHRYDHDKLGYVTYYDFAPSPFGDMAVGEGYWFCCLDPAGCQIQYQAYNDRQESMVELPTSGWYMIGGNAIHNHFEGLAVTTDTDASLFPEAANVWVQDPFFGYDNLAGGYFTAGVLPTDDDHYLRPWNGYWAYAFVGDLALVVPGDQPPYPKMITPEDGATVSGHSLVAATDLQAVPAHTINSVDFQVYLDGEWQTIAGIWGSGEARYWGLPPWENIWDTRDMATGDYPFRVRVDSAYGEFHDEITVHVNNQPVADFAVSLSDHDSVVLDGGETSPQPSYDPEDGPNIEYRWHFSDDAAIFEGPVVDHPVPVPGSPEAPYEFSVELEVYDTEGAYYEKHQIITVEYTASGSPDIVFSRDKTCGCWDMDIKNTGESYVDQWWMPQRKKRALGPYARKYRTKRGIRYEVRHNFNVIARLYSHSDPDQCFEAQGVQGTMTFAGRAKHKRGRELNDDWSLGGWTDCEYDHGWGKHCDDDYRYRNNRTKFYRDQERIIWLDGPGAWHMKKSSLPYECEGHFVAIVSGDGGWCRCDWTLRMRATKDGPVLNKIVEKHCSSGP